MTREGRVRVVALLSLAAIARLALPAPALATASDPRGFVVPICGEAGNVLLIRAGGQGGGQRDGQGDGQGQPRKPSGDSTAPCCAICHSAMRKRAGGDSCCGDEEDEDVA